MPAQAALPHSAVVLVQNWWRGIDRAGWRNFWLAIAALTGGLALSLYSAAAAETGHLWLAGASATASLILAGWVAITIVPRLAVRTPLRWLAYQIDYKLTREGVVYISVVFAIALAALNTGNNLLFIILSSLIAGILISGLVSRVVLSGVQLRLELPEHVFAQQPALAQIELENEKFWVPSFSLLVVGNEKKAGAQIFTRAVYFPYIPRQRRTSQGVELVFPRRGVYHQEVFGIRTKFPFGFLQKTRKVDSALEVVVYPRVEPTEEFYEILPLISGEMESLYRGRGHDLYAIRDYQPTDSARFVDWKATAKAGGLKVREFTREDERRVQLVFDPFVAASVADAQFERAVSLCACLAWHFHEIDSEIQFRTDRTLMPMAPAGEMIYAILRDLAFAQPRREEAGGAFLHKLVDEPDVFKIILTSQPRGSIPTSLWTSSYFIFIQDL